MSDPSLNVIAIQIGAAASLSGEVDIGVQSLVGIVVPTNWTTAGISLQASYDGGTTWSELVDQTATAIGSSSLTGGTLSYFVAVDPTKLRGIRSLKIRSGTQAAPVSQVASVTLQLITRAVF